MNKLTTILIALYLLAGCSSGGGTSSSGEGVGSQTTATDQLLVMSATMVDPETDEPTLSHNVYNVVCSEGGEPEGVYTAKGEATVTSTDLSDSSGLTPVEFFPEGITFTSYKISHQKVNPFSPVIHDQTLYQSVTLPNGSSEVTFTFVILDIDVLQDYFIRQNSGSVSSYNVTIQLFGKEFNGNPISVTAQFFAEYGPFCKG